MLPEREEYLQEKGTQARLHHLVLLTCCLDWHFTCAPARLARRKHPAGSFMPFYIGKPPPTATMMEQNYLEAPL